MDYAIVTVGPRSLFVPPAYAAARMADPPTAYPRDWRLGAGAFGRNYGAALAARTSLETARFLTAALLHEDFRYRPSISTNPFVRGFHALAFTFVDRSDSEHNRIAFANFAGAGASGFVGDLYMPAGFNNPGHAETRMAIAFGGFALQNLLREFTPDLLKATQKTANAPQSRVDGTALPIMLHIGPAYCFALRYFPFKCGIASLFSLQTYSSSSVSTINVTG
jgi:hypothetical protein